MNVWTKDGIMNDEIRRDFKMKSNHRRLLKLISSSITLVTPTKGIGFENEAATDEISLSFPKTSLLLDEGLGIEL